MDPSGQVELDEFAAPAVVQDILRSYKPRVEAIFRVVFDILGVLPTTGEPCNSHSLGCTGEDPQTWLQLRGRRADVHSAKVFIRGLCSQELQMEVLYPRDLHCVFTGAKQLFLECLIRGSGAFITVGSQGHLLLSGLTEPVVLARSRIMDLVEKYERNQRVPEPREAATKRRFKTLVESRADKHALDLLLLPSAVKEELLELASESTELGSPRLKHRACAPTFNTPSVMQQAEESTEPQYNPKLYPKLPKIATESLDPICEDPQMPQFDPHQPQLCQASGDSLLLNPKPNPQTPQLDPHQPRLRQALGDSLLPNPNPNPQTPQFDPHQPRLRQASGDSLLLSSGTEKEFQILLKFFTTMGYQEKVVEKVLAKSGLGEASQILDRIQQEQEGCVLEEGGGSGEEEPNSGSDDFVLGVIKSAAAHCGYTEEEVVEVYREAGGASIHGLLAQLQADREGETGRSQFEAGERVKENHRAAVEPECEAKPYKLEESQETVLGEREVETILDHCSNQIKTAYQQIPTEFPAQTRPKMDRHSPPTVKGPPYNFYNSGKQDSPLLDPQRNRPARGGKAVRAKDRKRAPEREGTVVTGQQRYLEALQTPFNLTLTDAPGEESLRHIIIDGSNVAMTHGLGQYFSCRGIALAVQYFWNKGHRNITVFVPQWRQKRDARIKEQKYLTELQNVGLLSYTPSREVEGKRITAYDDRFMLQLAEKAGGVILTNDNLRDFIDESQAWRNLIKKRLLQYTFAGDLFMVPDDPLGRSGPHLNEFLSKTHRSPAAGNHTYAGRVPTNPTPTPPRAQSEVLQYQDRTLEGAAGALQYQDRPAGVSRAEPGLQYRDKPAGVNREVSEGHTGQRRAQETECLKRQLLEVFSDQESAVDIILNCNPTVRDVNKLSEMILSFEM